MDIIYETSTRIGFVQEVFSYIIGCILLVRYYKLFLVPKFNNRHLSLIGFGIGYLLLRYAVGIAFSDISEPVLLIARPITIAGIIYTLSSIFFKRDLAKNVFLMCSYLAVQNICLFISISIGRLSSNAGSFVFNILWDNAILNTELQATMYFNILIIINSIMHLTIYTIAAFSSLKIIAKSFIYKNYSLRLSELFSLVLPCLSALVMTNIIRIIIFNPNGSGFNLYDNNLYISQLFFIAATFLLLTMIASVNLFQKTIQLHSEEKNVVILQKQTQQLQEQIRGIDNIYDEIKGMRHDMKSHLSNIQILVRSILEGNQSVVDELEDYLGKLGDTLNKFEFAYKTGNSISDVIIHQKYIEAFDNKIDFSSDFLYPTRLNIDAYDLAVILNNALENAIEACNNVPETDRFIRVYSYTKGEMFFINVENSFTERFTIDEDTALPVSKKDDKTAHGIGLSNIQRCARNYYGDIDFQVSETRGHSIFRLTVMLQSRK